MAYELRGTFVSAHSRLEGSALTRRGLIAAAGLAGLAGAVVMACGRTPVPSGRESPAQIPSPAAAATGTGTGTPVAATAAIPPAAAAAAAAAIQQGAAALQGVDYAKIEILTEKLAPNVYALKGSPGIDPGHPEAAGGRIGILAGPDGVLMVDAQYAPLTDKVLAAINGRERKLRASRSSDPRARRGAHGAAAATSGSHRKRCRPGPAEGLPSCGR
jgi:hypothetical protein